MDQEEKEKIVQSLIKKGVKRPCPRCETFKFEVVGQTSLPLIENLKVITLGGPIVPAAIVVCSNCGFITLHALGMIKE